MLWQPKCACVAAFYSAAAATTFFVCCDGVMDAYNAYKADNIPHNNIYNDEFVIPFGW